jgi:hypothetical protein
MPAPVATTNRTAGSLLTSTTLAASGNTTFDIDYSTKFGGRIQLSMTFGTVAATSGVQVDVFGRVGAGPAIDNQSIFTITVPSTASSTQLKSIDLPWGRYRIKLTNLDATNSVTAVTATDDTFDSVT